MSIILGVDPGTRVTGYGVLQIQRGSSQFGNFALKPLGFGVIRLSEEKALSERLCELTLGYRELLQKYQPTQVVIEKIFLGKNADSAFKLGHARGVLMAESMLAGASVHEYATRIVKKTLTGKGSGGKEEVQVMVERLLGLKKVTHLDSSDALALAIHHALSERLTNLKQTAEIGL